MSVIEGHQQQCKTVDGFRLQHVQSMEIILRNCKSSRNGVKKHLLSAYNVIYNFNVVMCMNSNDLSGLL